MYDFGKLPKERQEEILKNAKEALAKWQNDPNASGAGYNILRYARMGLLEVKAPEVKIPGVKTKLQGFAIYNKDTGQWSRGGTGPDWSKNAKVWSGLGPLKNHLSQFVHPEYPNRYNELKGNRFVISNRYKNCVVINVTTGLEEKELDIYTYLRDYVNRQKARSQYYSAYEVFEEE